MLSITDLSLRIAGRLLIDGANLTLPAGSKAGLVGRNGSGKTTLFRAITKEIAPEAGSITMPHNVRIGRVEQEAPGTDEALIDIVLAAGKERIALLEEAQTATDPNRIAEIQTRLADIGAHASEARAAAILHGLGFNADAQKRPAKEFSGGWRMRVALAAILFSEPDLLLLDEPTNYLDLEGTIWLEGYLARYPHTVLLISHDRDLLNRAVTSIVHLEQRKLKFYSGGYDQFERQRAEKLVLEEKQREKHEAKRKHMEAFVERFRYKASKARQAQSRLKALEKLGTTTAAVTETGQPITFPKPEKQIASPAIALDGVSVGYRPGNPILKRLNLRIDADDRIALLGANGNGKSTFAKLIAARLKPESGTITCARNLKTAMFAQHQIDDLVPDDSAYLHVRRACPGEPEAKVRGRVAQMGLSTEKMDTAARDLSGGEKARLLMGLSTLGAPNLVILDEPTNHLDIDGRRSLIDALNDFDGAVILVTHDPYLIEATADRLWLVHDGSVSVFEGDLDDYRRFVTSSDSKNETPKGIVPTANSKAEKRRENAQLREKLKPVAKKIKETESLMESLAKKIQALESELADPDLYAHDSSRAGSLARQRSALIDELSTHEENWLALSAEYEEGMAQSSG
jgi:ATP-binding cassette subfamily F protein 3